MNRIGEKDIILPALKLVRDYPNIKTSEIITKLSEIMKLSDEDKVILSNRNDTKFSQIVRNMCKSHKGTSKFLKYVITTSLENESSFILNEQGILFVDSEEEKIIHEEISDYIYQKEIQISSPYNKEDLLIANSRDLKKIITSNERYKVDKRIAKSVIEASEYKCEFAMITSVEHLTFETKKDVKYQEGHHLIPMSAQKDFDMNIDRSENIVCLCPICHRAIHYGSKEEKLKILYPLFKNRISDLNSIGIRISIEELYNRYYK